jgi:hypothetical protein
MAGAGKVGALALEQLSDDPLALRYPVGQSSVAGGGQTLRHLSLIRSAGELDSLFVRLAEHRTEASGAPLSSIFDIAKPTWISTQSPTFTASLLR